MFCVEASKSNAAEDKAQFEAEIVKVTLKNKVATHKGPLSVSAFYDKFLSDNAKTSWQRFEYIEKQKRNNLID